MLSDASSVHDTTQIIVYFNQPRRGCSVQRRRSSDEAKILTPSIPTLGASDSRLLGTKTRFATTVLT
jgi:hypothetical protein